MQKSSYHTNILLFQVSDWARRTVGFLARLEKWPTQPSQGSGASLALRSDAHPFSHALAHSFPPFDRLWHAICSDVVWPIIGVVCNKEEVTVWIRSALKVVVFLLFVFGRGTVLAADASTDLDELKQEAERLQQRIQELERRQEEEQRKAVEAERRIAEVEQKAAKAEKEALLDRVHLGGEARFRVMTTWLHTSAGFYGGDAPLDDRPPADTERRDDSSFPLRFRLNMWAEVVPDIVDFYGRLTMNKRWGAWDASISSSSDPFNKPNSFEASIGHDLTLRVEQAYATFKLSPIRSTWYVGILPGLDGPPSRQAGSLFPRLFIDSEIDGTLIKWDAPATRLDEAELPWARTKLRDDSRETESTSQDRTARREFASRKAYQAKAKEKTGILLGYLKYDEQKESVLDDADVFIGQGLLKLGGGTSLIADVLFMDDWYMPYGSSVKAAQEGRTDLVTDYYLTGAYVDTQLMGFQFYGAFYYSHFEIPRHTWSTQEASGEFGGAGFPGHLWFVGFNTGDLIAADHQFTAEYSKGSDAWINPFNYRGYRRKGTVLSAARNNYYQGAGVVGFYPFNAGMLDIYYDYFFRSNVRFRVGFIYFNYDKHIEQTDDRGFSILGSSQYEIFYWPYGEFNISF